MGRFAMVFTLLWASSICYGQDSLKQAKDSLINIAVLSLHNTDAVTQGEAEIISDRMASELFKTGEFHIMEREQMKAVLAEQGFQQSGVCNDEQCMVNIGKILGVQEILTGSIGKLGSLFILNIRLIDVSTGGVQKIVSRDLNGMDVVVNNLASICSELTGKNPVSAPPAPPTPPPTTTSSAPPAPETKPEPAPVILAPPIEKKPENTFKMGIRFGTSFIFGETMLNLNRPSKVALNDAFSSIKSGPVSTPSLKVTFIVAKYLNFEGGIGYSFWNQELTLNTNINSVTDIYKLKEKYNMISLQAGAGGSILLSNVRLNAGIILGYCILNNSENSTLSAQGQTIDFSYYIVKTKTNAPLIGAKTGVDVLLTDHFGINFDFLFQYVKFPSAILAYNSSISASQETLEINLPKFGGVFGISYYF